MTHSVLMRCLNEDSYKDNKLEKVVQSVATFKKPTTSSTATSAAVMNSKVIRAFVNPSAVLN